MFVHSSLQPPGVSLVELTNSSLESSKAHAEKGPAAAAAAAGWNTGPGAASQCSMSTCRGNLTPVDWRPLGLWRPW